MSGIFGIAHETSGPAASYLLGRVAAALKHRPWHHSRLWASPDLGIGLGHFGIGIFNRDPQPVWNSDHTACLVMAGEFYNLMELGLGDISPEQAALVLYERGGIDFAKHLNGAFVIAIWDQRQRRVIITNDRFGLYPLFYSSWGRRLIFAPEMKGVLCEVAIPRHLDLTALAQYMRFQHLLGHRTFFEDVHLLPAASYLVFDLASAACTIRTYWAFSDIPHRPAIPFAEAAEEAGRLLRLAVQRLSSDAHRPGVFLSGGLDSRSILGLIQRRPVVSMSYGKEGCRDVYYARQIAAAVGSDHHWVDFPNGEWLKDQVDFHLELTEGFHSWIHAHGISTLPLARQLFDVNLTGWDGGTVMGHPGSIEPLQVSPVSDAALTTRLFYLFNQQFTWPSLTEAEEQFVYAPALRRRILGRAFESFQNELKPFLSFRPDVRAEFFFIRNHCARLTHNLITFNRSHIEVRFPFFDYALFDFLYSLPARLRASRVLHRSVIQREMARLAYIPYDYDEFLPTTQELVRSVHSLIVRIGRRLRRYVLRSDWHRPTLYADYENYLRNELRPWAEKILFDQATAEQGLFDVDYIRTLMAHHVSAVEPWTIGKIAPIITYLMMSRRFGHT
jgi:asparagine synthase (glutamine-hydrolysing)